MKKTEKNILIAFLLNLSFSIIEFIGGTITNSVAILSDSVHDIGDALSIGISYFLERKSNKKPDKNYTYGYLRYSVLGGFITTMILFIGSIFVIYNSILRIINPVDIHYEKMIIIAVFGVIVNTVAAYFTKDGKSLNQKAVNLHMLEDVLGWIVVLIGAIIMNFTNIKIIDSIMSIGVSIFVLIHATKEFKEILDLFLEKVPKDISIDKIKNNLLNVDGILDIHHIHVWSISGEEIFLTMHVVINKQDKEIKNIIRETLKKMNINHVTIEIEEKDEKCFDEHCHIKVSHTHHH